MGQSRPPLSLAPERVPFLDLLRGVAMLGILPINVLGFGLPSGSASRELTRVTPLGDLVALHLTRAVFQYKFITIFAFLFGAGMAILARGAERRGLSPTAVLLNRLLSGCLLGVGHAVFLWYGDILSWYALLGLLSFFWAPRLTPRTLVALGAFLLAVYPALLLLIASVAFAASSGPVPAEMLPHAPTAHERALAAGVHGSWFDFANALSSWSAATETALFRDASFVRMALGRAYYWNWGLTALVVAAWPLLGLFFLGMAGVKSGHLLRPAENLAGFRRAALLGFGLGLPAQAASSYLALTGAGGLGGSALAELGQYIGGLGLATAYAGVLAHLAVRPRALVVLSPLVAVGRTAFSNYVGQSVLCGALFCSYGFRLFGSLSPLRLWAVTLGVWAVTLAASSLWLRWFSMGPLELVWRKLTYGFGGGAAGETTLVVASPAESDADRPTTASGS